MSTIAVVRPAQRWSIAPRTVLPTALLAHLVRPHWNYTVLLDGRVAGEIGNDQTRVLDVEPGEHTLRLRFVRFRLSEEMRISLREGEERHFRCGTSRFGWPTLREAPPEDAAERRSEGPCRS